MKKRAPGKLEYASPGAQRAGTTARFDRRWLAGCCAVIAIGVAIGYAGSSAGMLVYRLLTDGVVAVAWASAAVGLGWPVVRRFESPLLLRMVTAAAVGLGAMSLAALGLGLAGALNAATAWGILLAGIASVAWRVWRARETTRVDRAPSPWRAPAGWSSLALLAMPFLGLSLVGAVVPPGILWQDEPAGYDVTEYHLQVPREWFEAGRIVPLAHNVFSYMPMNVEMHDLLAMHLRGGPWSGMYLAQFMHVGWTALAVAAAWAVAAALADRPWAGPLTGTAVAVVPWVTSLAPVAYNEAGVMLFGTLALGWVMLARGPQWWAVAGALAGFACGVKLTAVAMVVAAILIAWVAVNIKARFATAPRPLLGPALFVVASILVFAPWLVRNQIWAGNPVFPERMEWFGRGHFSQVQETRWRKAHSPRDDQKSLAKRAAAAWRGIAVDWRYGYAFFPAVIAAMIVVRDRRAGFVAVVLAVQLAVWLALTHLQGRFFVLAIPLGAIVVGLVRERASAIAASCIVAVIATIGVGVLVPRYELVRTMGEASALGVEDLEFVAGHDLGAVASKGPIVLVGDAQAFWYSRWPMSHVRYRTVFDVGDGDWKTAWGATGPGAAVIFPGELARFARTYYDVAMPPEDLMRDRTRPFVLDLP